MEYLTDPSWWAGFWPLLFMIAMVGCLANVYCVVGLAIIVVGVVAWALGGPVLFAVVAFFGLLWLGS